MTSLKNWGKIKKIKQKGKPLMLIDLDTPLKQTEVHKIVTHFRGIGIIIKYRELIGFSPKEASQTDTPKRNNLTAQKIAEAAGRK